MKTRISKVEQAVERNLVARYVAEIKSYEQQFSVAVRFTEAEYTQMAKEHVEMLREAPPVPVGTNKVDIEPTLRFMAQQQGWDVVEVLAVARQVIADMAVNQ